MLAETADSHGISVRARLEPASAHRLRMWRAEPAPVVGI